MNAPSVDIKDILVAEGSALGLVFPVNLFIAETPVSPKNAVTIIDTSGSSPDTSLSANSINNPTIQIRVRNLDYRIGWALCNDIQEALHGRANETWNATYYLSILTLSEVGYLGKDDSGLHLFSVNFNLKRR